MEKAWDKEQQTSDIVDYRHSQISYLPRNQVKLCNTNGKVKSHIYTFDTILPPSTTQRQTFETVAEQTCDEILQGYNGTIFVYGQSGSGTLCTVSCVCP